MRSIRRAYIIMYTNPPTLIDPFFFSPTHPMFPMILYYSVEQFARTGLLLI